MKRYGNSGLRCSAGRYNANTGFFNIGPGCKNQWFFISSDCVDMKLTADMTAI
jgi:hypothetical protein